MCEYKLPITGQNLDQRIIKMQISIFTEITSWLCQQQQPQTPKQFAS